MLQEALAKLVSDRLWAFLAFLALLIADSAYDLGLPEEHMTNAMYVTMALILGKSIRGTQGGSMLQGLVTQVMKPGVEEVVPKMVIDAKPNDIDSDSL